ncbi:hypothetical protein MTP03_38080 [Tsukamurella sp. PLM1]|nr:hypothetical protein MTP03_38080 [Tsukamurella sp. PLM1]
MKRRESQARCPDVHIAQADEGRDARVFEPVAGAVAALIPLIEVLRPGLIVLPARGAARFFGGEEQAAERLVDAASSVGAESLAGVADEVFTAALAARRGVNVAPGGSTAFLAPLPIAELGAEPALAAEDRAELIDLLRRLGLRTVEAFAELSATDVATRFGTDAIAAHRQARAVADEAAVHRAPASRPGGGAAARSADRPGGRGGVRRPRPRGGTARQAVRRGRGLPAVGGVRDRRERRAEHPHLAVRAAAHPGRHGRSRALADRRLAHRRPVREPLRGTGRAGPGAPISLLRLEPVEVVDAGALQATLGGDLDDGAEGAARFRRALVRVQGLLGGEAVRVPVRSGGRGPAEQVAWIALGDEQVPARNPDAPWPGRMPQPAPARLIAGAPVMMTDAAGEPVRVTERGGFTGEPTHLAWGSRGWALSWWAGPWLVDERWWEPPPRPGPGPGPARARPRPGRRSRSAAAVRRRMGGGGRVRVSARRTATTPAGSRCP